MQAIGNNVILKEEKKEATTSSGIILNPEAQDRSQIGVVVAIGSKVCEVKEGDRVVFRKYAPDQIEMEGEEYLIVNESDIMAVVV